MEVDEEQNRPLLRKNGSPKGALPPVGILLSVHRTQTWVVVPLQPVRGIISSDDTKVASNQRMKQENKTKNNCRKVRREQEETKTQKNQNPRCTPKC